jgi:hypothetical protein
MRIWTGRGTMLESDKKIVKEIAGLSREGVRVFVTGEAREEYLGCEAADMLWRMNDRTKEHGENPEPLFIRTREGTVRMARFNPEEVWRCFHPDKLVAAVEEESARLGREPVKIDEFDFYRSFVLELIRETNFQASTVIVGKDDGVGCYQAVYMGALLLFNKPGYMDVPVEKHFCLKATEEFVKNMRFRALNRFEEEEYQEVLEAGKNADALTNSEITFLLKLYENGMGR